MQSMFTLCTLQYVAVKEGSYHVVVVQQLTLHFAATNSLVLNQVYNAAILEQLVKNDIPMNDIEIL